MAGLVHEGVPSEVFFALTFDGHFPQGKVTFHEGFKANGPVKESSSSPNYARWAVTGVIAPVLVIVILRFAIAPFIWGSEVAASLGSALGGIFILWLLFLAIAAVLWKIRHEKDEDEKDDRGSS